MFPSIQALGAEAIRKKFRRSPSYPLETFDVKLTSIGSVGGGEGETRLDIRLLVRKSDDGRTGVEVALVKKNEIKDVTFDILNIHRLILNQHKYCSPLFFSTENMMCVSVFTTTSVWRRESLFLVLLGRWLAEWPFHLVTESASSRGLRGGVSISSATNRRRHT